MLAETSRTTIADEWAGSVTIVSVCGFRETRATAMTSPVSVAASAILTKRVRVAAG
jgi:hypothetical protein